MKEIIEEDITQEDKLKAVAMIAALCTIDLADNVSESHKCYMRGELPKGALNYVMGRQAGLHKALFGAGFIKKHPFLQIPVNPDYSKLEGLETTTFAPNILEHPLVCEWVPTSVRNPELGECESENPDGSLYKKQIPVLLSNGKEACAEFYDGQWYSIYGDKIEDNLIGKVYNHRNFMNEEVEVTVAAWLEYPSATILKAEPKENAEAPFSPSDYVVPLMKPIS